MSESKISVTQFGHPGGLQLIEQQYSSLIPPPSMMKEYEKIHPGATERLFSLAESQVKHRQEREIEEQNIRKLVIIREHHATMLGQISSFVLISMGLVSGLYLIINDKPASGFATILGPLAIIGATALSRRKR
jgi:uncharacterized membrane protein